ncbi:DNA repair protein RecN [Hydrogenovibrio kuenenii]|uniref:DNA repair protein RecN n=1 Tax=Hydrogenovibrio kuenenii TaxID=63658 RepID=UPI00046650D5|nr:DNA repair protein RecN [Hydrogenovibrio kuenenii]
MLQTLTIQNLALIEKLSLDFHSGFTTLTGETGAGKSILLDALGLALGERADSGLVRHGTARADITADFDINGLAQVQTWLTENEFDDQEDDAYSCLLRRTITSEGRSKAYINGLPASISQLKALSDLLIDIHGQHEHQSLLHSNKQLELLDAYANHPAQLQSVREAYQQWQSLKKRHQELLEQQTDRQSQLDLLSFQLQEFDKVMPVADEYDGLAEEQNSLAHANEIKQAVFNAYDLIEGDGGVSEKLNSAIHALESVTEYSPALASVAEQLNSLLIDAQEAANDIQAQDHHIDLDPVRLQAVDDRLSELFGLAKRYTLEPQDLVEKHQQIRESLAELQDSDASLEQLKQEIDLAETAYQKAATALTKSRQTSGKKLSDTVTDAMKTLGMENGQFKIDISPADKPSATGSDAVSFQVTANKGQPLQPLAKVASGGELSRISLAIQVASAEVASLPTLIFDEVDVGIGGGIAEVVGQKMQQLGQHRQIFSITHLAQVAAYGQHHLNIAKATVGEQTLTQVTTLNEAERVEELARMLGGMTITENTRNHAKEMLATAQKG